MIKFFRRTRQNLLAEGKTGKYLKYAIGEILLVVIGILIAIQINNFQEQSIEDSREQAILKQLRAEFNSNLNQLDSKIALRNDVMNDLEDCLHYFAVQEVPSDSLLTAKLSALMLPLTFDPIQNELVGSGKIQLIKNIELKTLLTNWASDVHQLREVEQIYVDYFSNSIIPFFNRTGTARNIIKSFWSDSTRTSYLMEEYDRKEPNFVNSSIAPTSVSLLNNAELEGLISMGYALNITNSYESQGLRKRINEILRLIEIEIKE
ncbi:DUF6090 family protein [uncultured Eudoraea sp.]|uniref:DUF6090 family protein n=1 Tax=uncultured Eudoraea sp. TaxID=1035614 RepID=UPI002610742A|nr:DUF6090 family protein [uncultured Eudoraea sp.]